MLEEEIPTDTSYWKMLEGYEDYESYYKVIDKKLKTDPCYAFKYAMKNGRLPEEYESVFLKSAEFAFNYSLLILRDRLPKKLEKVFQTSSKYTLLYYRLVLKNILNKKELPKTLEKGLKKCSSCSYGYALHINKRLNKDLEKVFIKDAKDERCEDCIKTLNCLVSSGGGFTTADFSHTYRYYYRFVNEKFPEEIHKALFLRYSFDENINKQMLKKYFENS